MTYAETLEYLFARLPMYSRIGAAAYKEDLHNTIALVAAIDDPHHRFKSIHIAGTNGKGSVSHMLAAILQKGGYKTGLYTSPHLVDFRERIRINGTMIPEEKVIAFTERMRPAIEKIDPSFFELTVAMAFDHFAQEQVDIAVIETGLGGRLDSTNVIDPELSIITNIGWDHMNLLGNTLSKIAYEKAGIIKSNIPVVIGEWVSETKEVFEEKAGSMQAPITWAGSHFQVVSSNDANNYLQADVLEIETDRIHTYSLELLGHYQLTNLKTVLEAVRVLNGSGWNIPEHAIQEGLRQVKSLTGFWGRWDVLRREPYVILDVTHNVHGLDQVLQQLKAMSFQQLHIVLGMVNDKDIQGFLEKLPKHANYYFTQASIPRALPASELKTKANSLGLTGDAYTQVNEAIGQARQQAMPNDLVLVTGSIFLIGEVNPTTLQ
ncbi:MAG: bifunctional folylpolyglutamate synthase/dihydrofolate synthase [Bacteroidota bacterium]